MTLNNDQSYTFKSVAIIDDDQYLTDFLSEICNKAGWSVTTYNSTTFVNLFYDAPPDVFIIDVWFDQRADGLNQVIALKDKEDLANIPIIMMSSDASMKSKSEELGAFAFLEKPLAETAVVDTLNQAVTVLPNSYSTTVGV